MTRRLIVFTFVAIWVGVGLSGLWLTWYHGKFSIDPPANMTSAFIYFPATGPIGLVKVLQVIDPPTKPFPSRKLTD